MKKRLFLIISFLLASLLVLASCSNNTPTIEISEDGYWVINGEKTDVKAGGEKGDKGDTGEQGAKGDKGDTGEQGAKGDEGDTPTIEISEDGYWVINGVKTKYKASVAADAEEGTDGLDYYLLPDGTYGVKAGKACYLETIVIPSTYNGIAVTAILDRGFSPIAVDTPCENLKSITIPNSITSIWDEAFRDCDSLTSVTIGDSVTSIGDFAFRNCSSLTSVTIPDSVTTIGSSAFSRCTGLTSVTIPDSVTLIGDDAFYCCYILTSIKYRGTQSQWNAISKGYDWNFNTGNYTITYNYDGE